MKNNDKIGAATMFHGSSNDGWRSENYELDMILMIIVFTSSVANVING